MRKKKTQAEFVAQFHQVHLGKDYKIVGKYIDLQTKVVIQCLIHGIWEATPNNLLRGKGCPQCGIKQRTEKRRKTQSKFVTEFNQVHEGKNYQVVGEYINTTTKMAIQCPIHGSWKALPSNLLKGSGCPQCAGTQKKTHAEFVDQFNQVHEGKGYQVIGEYINNETKIAFECPAHGIWEAIPGNLLFGQGCPQCGNKQRADKKRKPQHEFIVQFNQVHEGKGYKVIGEYINNHANLTIQCPTHGIWQASPGNLLRGKGCVQCGNKQQGDKKRKSQLEFIAQFNQVHEGKNYQVVGEYININTKIAIKCPTHGIWEAAAWPLLAGSGCPCCARKGFNPAKEAVFYLLEIDKNRDTYYGFGISNQYDVRKKGHLRNLTKGNAVLKNEWTYQFQIGYECRELENRIKLLLKEKGLAFNLEINGFLDECAVETALPMILRCIDESKHVRHSA